MVPHDPHAIIQIGQLRHFDTWADGHNVLGVEVELATGETSRAELRVFDPDPAYTFTESLAGGGGARSLSVVVQLGFGRDLGPPVFEGVLTGVEREFSTTVCHFSDLSFQMHRVQKTEYHRGLTDLQIIEKLARRNGLGFEGPERRIALDRHKSLKQEGRTDWAQALDCAEAAALVVYVRGRTLYAKEAAFTGEPAVTLQFRRDFLLLDDFHIAWRAPEDQEGRPSKVETRGRGRGGRRLRGESGEHARGMSRVEVKRDLRVRSKRQADKRAEARKLLQREKAFRGSVSLLPAFTGPRPDVRSTVLVEGLPSLFSGKYLIDRVTHSLEAGELTAELDICRDVRE